VILCPINVVYYVLCLYLQVLVAQKVAAGVYRGVTTSELDELAAETAAAMTSMHPDYALVSIILETALCCGARPTL
jgi:hypothetical protein